MYQRYTGLRTVTKTQTNVRLFLDDPNKRDRKFTKVVNVILSGTMEVFTQQQFTTTLPLFDCAAVSSGELAVLPWTVGDMPSSGDSELGTITMRGNPDLLTTGIITQNTPELAFPATLVASVFQILEIPGYGTLHNKYPIIVSGSVDHIPPNGMVAACRCGALLDNNNEIRGLVGGRTLTLMGQA
ncbi:MAG TPA: hypothetical protein VK749_09090 [Xanthobacteraceae bacterium]|jgi:hypothetical protein|nr:hypothetical protein [Xanthobacteraceae bacterium]